MQDIRAIRARIDKLHRRSKLTRDAEWEGAQSTSGAGTSEPSVGPRRILKLDGPGTAYEIRTEGDGTVWLVQHALVEGYGDPGKLGVPAATPTGDRGRDRHAAITAVRDRGAKFAAAFNQKQRQHWGS